MNDRAKQALQAAAVVWAEEMPVGLLHDEVHHYDAPRRGPELKEFLTYVEACAQTAVLGRAEKLSRSAR